VLIASNDNRTVVKCNTRTRKMLALDSNDDCVTPTPIYGELAIIKLIPASFFIESPERLANL
jgi:hypothetical protein